MSTCKIPVSKTQPFHTHTPQEAFRLLPQGSTHLTVAALPGTILKNQLICFLPRIRGEGWAVQWPPPQQGSLPSNLNPLPSSPTPSSPAYLGNHKLIIEGRAVHVQLQVDVLELFAAKEARGGR